MLILDEDSDNEYYLEEDEEEYFLPEHKKKAIENNRYEFVFLCIDVGIINLGMSIITTDFEYNIKDVNAVDLINISDFKCDKDVCKLKHNKMCSDWVDHLIQNFGIAFEQVNNIFIERQPPSGLVSVEQLILSKFRDKTILIHPCSMHKFFNISKYDYEDRKKFTEKIAIDSIKTDNIKDIFNSFERKHDMADSICIGIFGINIIRKEFEEYKTNKENEKFLNNPFTLNKLSLNGITINEWFNKFYYKKSSYENIYII